MEGDYNRFNIAAAVAIGRFFEVPEARIRRAIAEYAPDNHRSQRLETARNTLIVDCYNANPSSMRAAVEHFLRMPSGGRSRRVLILGDMLELGEWSQAEHADIVRLATQTADIEVHLVGAEFMRAAASLPALPRVATYPDRTALEAALSCTPLQDALVLIKGSHGIGLEKIIDRL